MKATLDAVSVRLPVPAILYLSRGGRFGSAQAAEVALNTTANQGAGLTAGPCPLGHVVASGSFVTYGELV